MLLGTAAFGALGPQQALSADGPPSSFDPALVRKGAQLAAIGNCAACHTAPQGKPFAGGRAVPTPFGTIYGSNITPEPDTGIGQWSREDFLRAMHEGVDRRGRNLYPAFPYDHFTRVTDEDVEAIYAFLMTRDPVRAETPPNELAFPINIRATVGVWKLLYFSKGAFQPSPSESAQWNRGAYLVEGLGHCTACHTPRNFLGAEKKSLDFTGGEAEGWHAPALNASSPSPVPWTADALYTYLRTGTADAHALTAGPMAEVTHKLANVAESDVHAIATYVASLDARPPEQREKQSRDALAKAPRKAEGPNGNQPGIANGAAVYAGACADCHDRGRSAEGGALPLPLATGLTMPTPRNLIRIIRDGIMPEENERGGWMPGFGGALTDGQLVDLVTYLRTLTSEPEWKDVPGDVRKIARGEE